MCSSSVERQLPKLERWVRLPSRADGKEPRKQEKLLAVFLFFRSFGHKNLLSESLRCYNHIVISGHAAQVKGGYNMKRKLTALLLTAVLAASLSACGGGGG